MAVFDPKTGFITELDIDPFEYIVVGTNGQGNHAGGLAKFAADNFDLEAGVAHGISGQCFCVDTMDGDAVFTSDLKSLIETAKSIPNAVFLLTPVGQGIAGYDPNQVNELLTDALLEVIGKSWSTYSVLENLPKNLIKVGW